MILKDYIIYTLNDLIKSKATGPVEFNLIVAPYLYKDKYELQVIGTVTDKDSKVSTIKFTVNL